MSIRLLSHGWTVWSCQVSSNRGPLPVIGLFVSVIMALMDRFWKNEAFCDAILHFGFQPVTPPLSKVEEWHFRRYLNYVFYLRHRWSYRLKVKSVVWRHRKASFSEPALQLIHFNCLNHELDSEPSFPAPSCNLITFWSQFGKLGVLELHCVSHSVRLSHLVSAITWCILKVCMVKLSINLITRVWA